ncbi:MAG: HWE histidine kinase domain-containing protein [Pseudomonadota bacterium]
MSNHIHKSIFDRMPNAAMILDRDLVFVDANEAYCQAVQTEKSAMMGRYVFDVFPDTPERVEPVLTAFQRTLAGDVVQLDAQPYKLQLADGTIEDRIWQVTQFPIFDDAGMVQFLVQRCEDVTEKEALRKQRDLVTAELNHRVRNTMAVVQSIAEHTALSAPDLPTYLKSFSARLAAMSRNFAALTDSHWQGLDFETILRTELEPYAGPAVDRVTIDGVPMTLTVRASKFTSMMVHELITNAAKYGFLSSNQGQLSLRWWIENDRLHAEWRESGLVDVTPPEAFGFGFQLFDMMANIDVDPVFEPDGLKLHFSVPVTLSVATGEISFGDE